MTILSFFFERRNLLVEHDGSAISVFNKHANERHTDEYVIGIVVLWKKVLHKNSFKISQRILIERVRVM